MNPSVRLFVHGQGYGPLKQWSYVGAAYLKALVAAKIPVTATTIHQTDFRDENWPYKEYADYFNAPLEPNFKVNLVVGWGNDALTKHSDDMTNILLTACVPGPLNAPMLEAVRKFNIVGGVTGSQTTELISIGIPWAIYIPPTVEAMTELLGDLIK